MARFAAPNGAVCNAKNGVLGLFLAVFEGEIIAQYRRNNA